MTIKRDMVRFFDGNGLVCPDDQTGSPYKRGSDNGVLHTARYLIVQKSLGEALDGDAFNDMIKCMDRQGYVHRAPDDPSEDTPDDYYGLISCLSVLGLNRQVKLPFKCMHPMLIYMRSLQRGGFEGIVARSFSPIAAIVIALSNLGSSNEISNKMLTWNVIQGTKKSLLCRLGAFIWYTRNDIRLIAPGYYPKNPLGKAIT